MSMEPKRLCKVFGLIAFFIHHCKRNFGEVIKHVAFLAAVCASPAFGWQEPARYMLPAGFTKSKKEGRREYLRARIENGQVAVFPSEGSGRVSGLSWATGLVELGDPAQKIAAGDPVAFIPFHSFE